MNFINLAHGAFAMVGGYVDGAADEAARRAVPRHAAGRVPRAGARRRRPGTHALPPPLRRQPARSGAVHDRPRADGDAGGRLSVSAISRRQVNLPAFLLGRIEFHGLDRRRLSAVHRRGVRADRGGAAGLSRRDAVRRAIARRGRRPARRLGSRDRRRPPVRGRLRGRQRAGRARRRARRRRRRRDRSEFPASSSWLRF